MSNQLKRIDFSTGIHAHEIERNFRVLEARELRDKLRTIGYGIVEGFQMELEGDSEIKVSGGYLINREGKEIYANEKKVRIEPPESIKKSMLEARDALLVNHDGEITLPERPYSPSRVKHFDTASYQSSYAAKEDEIIIRSASNPNEIIQAVKVEGRIITLDAQTRRGQEVYVDYYYASNRVDAVLINLEGDIYIQKGTSSDAPSHGDVMQDKGALIIGLAEIIVEGARKIVLHHDYRTYTKVYVNEDGVLYLNGKKYEEVKMIHFEEPEYPEEFDVWYDQMTNKLMIWKNDNGDLGWTVINDSTSIPIRELKIFTPEEFPSDGKTFLFSDELPMRFMPKNNQVEVIIDNSPLMSDQFEEVIEEGVGEYVNAGIGVRLKDPLDKATYVEVRVHHSVQNTSLRRTFQRTAVFAQEGFVYHNAANTAKEFTTDIEYVMGEHQLQIYVEGKRLQEGVDYDEILSPGGSPASANKGKSSKTFKVRVPLSPGNRVSYRIEKNIYSYDNLDGWVDEIETKADKALLDIEETNQRITNIYEEAEREIGVLNNNLIELYNQVGDLEDYYKKTDTIKKESLPAISTSGTKKEVISMHASAGGIVTVENTKETDYFSVHYIRENMSRVLISGIEYAVVKSGNNLSVILDNSLVDSSATVYITGIRFGI